MVSHIFPRHTQDELPIASGGYGCFLFDESGKKYLDASGGAAVSCLGHSHPKIINALHEQLDALAYAHTSFFSSEPAEKLATFQPTDDGDRGWTSGWFGGYALGSLKQGAIKK